MPPKPHKPHRSQYDRKITEGWEVAQINVGATESAPFALKPTHTAHVGPIFSGDQKHLTGHYHPFAKILEDDANGVARVVVSAAAPQVLLALYKIEKKDDDEEVVEQVPPEAA